ncbi:Chaoptinlike, partial [Caligus rogercresseyi]
MERLFGNLFKPLTVRILKIADTPIKDISDGTFDQLSTSLEELYIQNSLLT